ncbi:MAG: PAS domain-containing protein [Planctomycetota bacterium]
MSSSAATYDPGQTVIPDAWEGGGLSDRLEIAPRKEPERLVPASARTVEGDTADPNGRTVEWTPPTGRRDGPGARRSDQGPPLPVRTLGDQPTDDYQLGDTIGEGGSGIVREAIQTAMGRTVAVKTLKPGRRKARARFLAEARVTAGLDHPNILPVYELAADERGEPFLVMKRVVGTPWSEWIGSLSRAENLGILTAVADAVAFAHSRGVVHRDIKPENVLLGSFGEVLLNDWGLALTESDRAAARAAQRRELQRCEADASVGPTGRLCGGIDATGIAGTPAYMAPEQARGDAAAVGPATDIYLLGAVLFEIAVGRRPHAGATLTECLRSAADNRFDLPPQNGSADPLADPSSDRPSCLVDPDADAVRSGEDGAAGDDPIEDQAKADETAGDAELVQIAREAMASEPADRPPGVAELMALLDRYESHAESARLVRRGRELAQEAGDSGDYATYGLATRTLMEAVSVWSDNPCAHKALRATRTAFAEHACDNGDLELAEGLIKAGELENEPVAARCRAARERLSRAEEEKSALEQGVRKWSRAFSASPDCVFLVDMMADGRITEVNDQFTRILGYRAEDVVGRTMKDVAFWPPTACRTKFVKALIDEGEFDNAEVDFHTKSGEAVPVLISARVTEVGDRRLVVANARDVTVKKAQEAALRKSEDRLLRTQRLAGLGTWELNVTDGSVYWSDETFRIAGLNPGDEPPGFDEYLETVHPDDRAPLLQALDSAGKGGEGFELQVRHRRPDGTWNRVLTRGEPIKNDAGQVVELFGSVLDQSEQ